MPCASPRRLRAPARRLGHRPGQRAAARAGSGLARVQPRTARLLLFGLALLVHVGRAFRLPAQAYFQHRQPTYAQLLAAPQTPAPVVLNIRVPTESPNPALMSAIAGLLQYPTAPGPPPQMDRLLETAALGMGLATGGEWVLFALAATRLGPQAKATEAGRRFQAALVKDLPTRLEMLEPAELVCIVNGWPRAGLDDLGRHVIQTVIEACIQRLDAFAPSELAQLVRGLCRPVTNKRLETLRALDAVAEETPDLNARSRLFKAATKVLGRRVGELSAPELAAFAEACSQEMSLQDGCKDLGPAFPRAYTRAVATHLPTFTLPELLPVLSGLLFARAAFRFDPDVGLLQRLGEAAVRRLEESESERSYPAEVALPLLVGFALLGVERELGEDEAAEQHLQHQIEEDVPRYDPSDVLKALTLRAHGAIDAYTPQAARLLLETLALPGHSYTPRAGVLAAFAQKAAGHLWASNPVHVVAAAQSLVSVVSKGATAEGLARSVQGFLRLRLGGGGGKLL